MKNGWLNTLKQTFLAFVADGISVAVLYWFGGGAARREGTSQFENPPATIFFTGVSNWLEEVKRQSNDN